MATPPFFRLIGQNVLMKTALQLDERDIARLAYDTRYE